MRTSASPPQIPQVFTTRLDVAAYLLVLGFEISDVKLQGPAATFAFKDMEKEMEPFYKEREARRAGP